MQALANRRKEAIAVAAVAAPVLLFLLVGGVSRLTRDADALNAKSSELSAMKELAMLPQVNGVRYTRRLVNGNEWLEPRLAVDHQFLKDKDGCDTLAQRAVDVVTRKVNISDSVKGINIVLHASYSLGPWSWFEDRRRLFDRTGKPLR